MVPNKEARELLKMYAAKKELNIPPEQKLRLFYLLGVHCNSILDVLQWLGEDHDVHPNILSLLSALSCNTPVCAILHPEEEPLGIIRELVADMSGTSVRKDANKMFLLQMHCPLIQYLP